MRNNIKLLCMICSLGLLAQCCSDDSDTPVPNDPGTSTDACQTPGYVRCNGICIDPMASNKFCGANAYCEGYEICDNGETCQNGRCIDNSKQPQMCNPACNPNQTCQNGTCVDNSEQPQTCTQDKCGEWIFGRPVLQP